MIDIITKYNDLKIKSIVHTPCNFNKADMIGYFIPELDGCLRRGVYERTHWAEKEPHDLKTQIILDESKNQKKQILTDLSQAGVTIIDQQTKYEWGEYQIIGYIDGKIVDESKELPIEIKNLNANIFTSINNFNDLKRRFWTRAYIVQITLYMLIHRIDKSIFIIKNNSSGELKQIDIDLDHELGEYCLKAVEIINASIKENSLPKKRTNPQKCYKCPFKMICLPKV